MQLSRSTATQTVISRHEQFSRYRICERVNLLPKTQASKPASNVYLFANVYCLIEVCFASANNASKRELAI